MAHFTAELSWLQELLKELKVKSSTAPVVWCDNLSASALASNPVYHARTKNIELDVHFVRDKVLEKKIEIRYVPTQDQIADCFTKGLAPERFRYLIGKLNVTQSPYRLRSGVRENDMNADVTLQSTEE